MRKLILPLIFLMFSLSGISQGWIYISGTVSDINSGYPVSGHPVTILMDSLNGMIYYEVVYTDSIGYYWDDIPIMNDSTGIFYVQTIDCNQELHQAVIAYNPLNITYTQDFQICTMNVTCEANFVFLPVPQGSPDSFQFTDLSMGDIFSWSWSFGDSTFSNEQSPIHNFPGPGTFNVCLTVSGNNCTDSFCQTLVISETVYHQLYGQVFGGNFPLQSGIVTLFEMNPGGGFTPLGEACPVDSNGVYFFTLVPDGIYLLQAVPYDSIGYLPTYYGDVINWQQAAQLVIGEPDNPYNINLVASGQMTPGPGSCAGRINTGNAGRASVDKISMMLMNESFVAIGFDRVSNSGEFSFPSLEYGTYYLRAELAGVSSDNMALEITAERPHVDIVLSFTGNSILGLGNPDIEKGAVSLYPNPVSDRLNISIDLPGPSIVEIGLYTLTGQLVYQGIETSITGTIQLIIPTGGFPAGLYMLRISTDNGLNVVRKVVKWL